MKINRLIEKMGELKKIFDDATLQLPDSNCYLIITDNGSILLKTTGGLPMIIKSDVSKVIEWLKENYEEEL